MIVERDEALKKMVAAVQYRRKDQGGWSTMASFDVEGIAESYCESCARHDSPWEYRWVALSNPDASA